MEKAIGIIISDEIDSEPRMIYITRTKTSESIIKSIQHANMLGRSLFDIEDKISFIFHDCRLELKELTDEQALELLDNEFGLKMSLEEYQNKGKFAQYYKMDDDEDTIKNDKQGESRVHSHQTLEECIKKINEAGEIPLQKMVEIHHNMQIWEDATPLEKAVESVKEQFQNFGTNKCEIRDERDLNLESLRELPPHLKEKYKKYS